MHSPGKGWRKTLRSKRRAPNPDPLGPPTPKPPTSPLYSNPPPPTGAHQMMMASRRDSCSACGIRLCATQKGTTKTARAASSVAESSSTIQRDSRRWAAWGGGGRGARWGT
jgi:hypothetical protein